jgi:hypothetical protein
MRNEPSGDFEQSFAEFATSPPRLKEKLTAVRNDSISLRRKIHTNAYVKAALTQVADLDGCIGNNKVQQMLLALQDLRTWTESDFKTNRAGNNKNDALTTAMISLAELYKEQFAFEPDLWKLPAGRTSSFIKFATEALNHVGKRDFSPINVAKYWERLRGKMTPTPKAAT